MHTDLLTGQPPPHVTEVSVSPVINRSAIGRSSGQSVLYEHVGRVLNDAPVHGGERGVVSQNLVALRQLPVRIQQHELHVPSVDNVKTRKISLSSTRTPDQKRAGINEVWRKRVAHGEFQHRNV